MEKFIKCIPLPGKIVVIQKVSPGILCHELVLERIHGTRVKLLESVTIAVKNLCIHGKGVVGM